MALGATRPIILHQVMVRALVLTSVGLAHVYFFGCKLLKLRGRFLRLVTT